MTRYEKLLELKAKAENLLEKVSGKDKHLTAFYTNAIIGLQRKIDNLPLCEAGKRG